MHEDDPDHHHHRSRDDAHRPAAPRPAHAHSTDPDLAAALFTVWSGDPALVVSSPPSAGKTRLVTHLAHQLHTRAGLTVAIAAQTRAQALDVTNRLATLHPDRTGLLAATKATHPRGMHPKANLIRNTNLRTYDGVLIATSARWAWTAPANYRADVLIIDKAYQLTYADLGSLVALADQVVLVGDPGQIAPVVTGSTGRWGDQPTGPHQPAPVALIAQHGAAVAHQALPRTWRLGPATTSLIQPLLYPDLPFTSARPPEHITHHGTDMPEIAALALDAPTGRTDAAMLTAVAARALDLLANATLTTADGTRPLTGHDLAVIAPHVDQATILAAHLAHVPDVLVATTNQAQGLERPAVVAVHPLAGYRTTPGFTLDPGRTCVALSRHRAHLTLAVDASTRDTLRRAAHDSPAADVHLHVRLLDTVLAQG